MLFYKIHAISIVNFLVLSNRNVFKKIKKESTQKIKLLLKSRRERYKVQFN